MNEKRTNERDFLEEEEIDLLDLGLFLLERIRWVILVTLIGAMIAGCFSYFVLTPTYTASSSIYIVTSSSNSVVNLSDLQIGSNLTSDYKTALTKKPFLEAVIKKSGMEGKMTVSELSSMIVITNPSNTHYLDIAVTSVTPEFSAIVANNIAEQALVWIPQIMQTSTPTICEYATVPEKKSGPSNAKNTLIGAIAGFVLCTGLFTVQYLLNDQIKDAADMEKYFGIVPFASIPKDPKMKKYQSVSKKRRKRGRSNG